MRVCNAILRQLVDSERFGLGPVDGKRSVSSARLAAWVVILAMLGSRWASGATTVSNVSTCEAEWSQVLELPHFSDQLARWQAAAPKCAGNGLYEVRLTGLLTVTGRYNEARQAVRAGLALNTPYKKELLGADAAISLNTMQLADAQKQYQVLIASYPDYFDGYCGMGALRLMERRFTEAVTYLNQAARHQQSWIIYRHLTIAYAQLHQHQRAVEAFDKAYRLNPKVVGDKDAIHAATRSLMFLGNYRAAEGAINLLLRANRSAGADPQIQETERIIQDKLREQTQ